jgi:hypothetical protein
MRLCNLYYNRDGVAKLVAHLVATTAAHWVRIQTSLKNTKWAI